MSLTKRGFLAFIAGSLSSLAFAPYFFFPLLFISHSLLLILIDLSNNKKQAFTIGFLYGLAHFIVGIHWIYHSLMVDFDKFAYLIPLVVIILPSLLAIYIALVALFTYLLKDFRFLGFCCFFVIGEYLRANLFTGFPWNLMGYSLAFSDQLIQSSAIFGVYGLSLLVLVLTSLPYLLYKKSPYLKLKLVSIILIFLANYLYGDHRLKNPTKYTDFAIRIVQPSTKQETNSNLERELIKLNNLIKMSNQASKLPLKLIIWPESGFNFEINETGLLDELKKAVPKDGYLVTSAIKLFYDNNKQHWSNSLFAINEHKEVAEYKKVHLVPFGEYIPLRALIPFKKIVSSIISEDCTPGKNSHNLKLENQILEFRPLICYEDIFANEVKVNDKAKLLISLTNDSWFGTSNGPYQHFQMSRFRAIEQGIPLIRAARTGISAFVDSYGRIIKKTDLEEVIFIDEFLPTSLEDKTLYSIYGDSIILIIIASLLLYIYLSVNKKYINSKTSHN